MRPADAVLAAGLADAMAPGRALNVSATLGAEAVERIADSMARRSVDLRLFEAIDFINGAVVRWGERLGIDTPVNRTLVACVKGIERSYVH